MIHVPTIQVNAEVANWIAQRCEGTDAIERAEARLLADFADDPFIKSEAWTAFRDALEFKYAAYDHVVVRGLPPAGGGVSLMWATRAVSKTFRTYRGGRVVKHFRMSPWTKDLSHTTDEGHFHTDLNTSPAPPTITAMQCLRPDPAGAGHGCLRVARLGDLLATLQSAADQEALNFLHESDVEMVNDSDQDTWKGRIVANDHVRFHPETIRAAARRHGYTLDSIEPILARIQQAALDSSAAIDLDAGDALIVSNTKALHYRNACTVKFNQFPRDFVTREVYILHALAV